MKTIAFAWTTFWYDFDTEEEAREYYKENCWGKGWQVKEPYDNGNGKWTVVVEKPYGAYNPGW